MDAIKKIAALIAARKKQILQIALGQTCKKASDWLFDNPLYLFVVGTYGLLLGGAIMTTLSLLICLELVLAYNRTKADWLGLDALEEIRHKDHTWWIAKLLAWLLRKGDICAFVALSILEDPFTVTVYLRHGKRGAMGNWDWIVFFGSVVLSNGYWTLRTFAVWKVAVQPILNHWGVSL
jgi:hypothetical protein